MQENWSQVLNQLLEARIERIHTMLPATIVSFDPSAMRATVKPTLKKVVGTADDNQKLDYPLIFSVPVDTDRSANFEGRLPYEAGDAVTIGFYGRSIEKIVQDLAQHDPGFSRKHHLTDAVVLGGRVTDSDPLPGGWSGDWVWKVRGKETAIRIHPDGNVTIQADEGKKIRLGAAAKSGGCGGSGCTPGSANDLQVYELGFAEGSVEITVNDLVEGKNSNAKGSVRCVVLSGGSWAEGDAKGTLYFYNVTGEFIDEEALLVSSVQKAIANGELLESPGDPCTVACDGAILGSRHKCWADSHTHICPACGSETSAPTCPCPDVSTVVEIGGGNPEQGGGGCGGGSGGGCCG